MSKATVPPFRIGIEAYRGLFSALREHRTRLRIGHMAVQGGIVVKFGEKMSSLMEGFTPRQLLMMAGVAGLLTFAVLYWGLSRLVGSEEKQEQTERETEKGQHPFSMGKSVNQIDGRAAEEGVDYDDQENHSQAERDVPQIIFISK